MAFVPAVIIPRSPAVPKSILDEKYTGISSSGKLKTVS